MKKGMIEYFEENIEGNDYAVGDIHGCFDTLARLLKDMEFNVNKDRLFSTGDLVDRGQHSANAVDWVQKHWFHTVRGNHDQMAIDWVDGLGDQYNYMANGGQWFLNLSKEERKKHADIFRELPLVIDIGGKVGIIHAECPFPDWKTLKTHAESMVKVDPYDGVTNVMIWGRDMIQRANPLIIKNIDLIVHGHNVVHEKKSLGNRIYIDTGMVYERDFSKLTIIKIEKGE